MGLALDRQGAKRAILAAVGLLGCGPVVGSDDDGSGDASGSSGATTSGAATSSASAGTVESTAPGTVGSVTSLDTGDVTTDPTGDPPMGCVPPPPDVDPVRCNNPEPRMQQGENGEVPSGFERCDDGRSHRAAVIDCEHPSTLTGTCDPKLGGTCITDADCSEAPYGYCNQVYPNGYGQGASCGCEYGCATDAECGDGQLCMCDGPRSRCVSAGCRDSADCGGWMCQRGEEVSVCDPAPVYFACGNPLDTCWTGGSFGSGACQDDACDWCRWTSGDCRWACRLDDDACSDCGRPYLIDGRARTASAMVRDDWSAPRCNDITVLDARDRATVATHWLRCGLAEHASVAAFARYALDLLSLAAPADLVVACAAAMSDEIEHARLCFALAASYGAPAHGPGPLASDDALGHRDPLRILGDVVREACIGETLAALDAIEALGHARAPAVRAALERIAEDELRHAQLGWRHLRWALDDADAPTREAIIDLVEAAIGEALCAPVVGAASIELRAHGVLDAETRVRARHDALLEVVRPCAAMLLAATARPSAVAVA